MPPSSASKEAGTGRKKQAVAKIRVLYADVGTCRGYREGVDVVALQHQQCNER